MHFRLSREVAYDLIARLTISPIFTSLQEHAGYAPISPEKHILCYLWFLGHESAGYRDVADRFNITISTLYTLLTRVTNFLMQFAPHIIRFPTLQEKEETKAYFLGKKQFPRIIGAVDGAHIRIDKPTQDKDSYINRKQYFSIHMQGVVNHKLKFLDVFIGYPGSVHDARVFRESHLYECLQDICLSSYIVGDSAYPCLEYLMVPYRDNGHLTRAQRNFNSRLSSCRVVVENAFGILKQRFRQLYHFKLRNIVRMVQIIHACCVLHNLASAGDVEFFEPPLEDNYPDPEAEIIRNNNDEIIPGNEHGRILRDELCRQLIAQDISIYG
ncbi:putative nuclease HARBI1 [Solenopsis invicta]|uniref:putative nuclease HARBI1 n=1 Tax=Solenopsis invicta TaxID=13686 RepID=UPI00193E9335|nr:putative nuclease HARBI1 [Solenopsis invicta]